MSKSKESKSEKPKQKAGAPHEMSTKQIGGGHSFLSQTEPRRLDPRFREECGEVDQVGFVKNYAFLQRHREIELKSIKRALKSDDPTQDRSALKREKQSLEDQHKTFGAKLRDVEDRMNWHREEKARVLEGKKPFWLDRRSMRERDRKRKFQDLQKSGKLQRYFQRRGKKLAAKDKKEGRIGGLIE
jgi:ribosomal RNA-processing protein 36